MTFVQMIPVLPTSDMAWDVKWYEEKAGFTATFGDKMYAGLKRENLCIHLQWHDDTEDDPRVGGSVIKVFVEDIQTLFNEFVERGTLVPDQLKPNTPCATYEFGFFDLNKNAIFFVENA